MKSFLLIRHGRKLMRRYLALLDLFDDPAILERAIPAAIRLRRNACACAHKARRLRTAARIDLRDSRRALHTPHSPFRTP